GLLLRGADLGTVASPPRSDVFWTLMNVASGVSRHLRHGLHRPFGVCGALGHPRVPGRRRHLAARHGHRLPRLRRGAAGLRGEDREQVQGDPMKTRAAIAALAAWILPQVANACSVCFGDPNAPANKGTSSAIFFLLAVVGLVQVGFVALFIAFWRRARAL